MSSPTSETQTTHHMDPLKFERSAQRFRSELLRIRSERPKIVVIDTLPPTVQGKRTQCTARTLEGRPCQFYTAPGCSGFCKKHFSMM